MSITIEPLKRNEIEAVENLLHQEISNSYRFENVDLTKYPHLVEDEMIPQKERLEKYFDHYLVAKSQGEIVGTITYIPATKPVQITLKELHLKHNNLPELGSLYISSHHQRLGIGSQLFHSILHQLINNQPSTNQFSVTTGWTKGRHFWRKTLGPETHVLPTYYNGHPCYVWIREIKEYIQ